jgi:hypothetical protein
MYFLNMVESLNHFSYFLISLSNYVFFIYSSFFIIDFIVISSINIKVRFFKMYIAFISFILFHGNLHWFLFHSYSNKKIEGFWFWFSDRISWIAIVSWFVTAWFLVYKVCLIGKNCKLRSAVIYSFDPTWQ